VHSALCDILNTGKLNFTSTEKFHLVFKFKEYLKSNANQISSNDKSLSDTEEVRKLPPVTDKAQLQMREKFQTDKSREEPFQTLRQRLCENLYESTSTSDMLNFFIVHYT